MHRKTLLCALLLTLSAGLKAQTMPADTLSGDTAIRHRRGLIPWLMNYLNSTNKTSTKAFDASVVAGPFYNATSSFSLGGGVAAQYSWAPGDSLLQKSSLSVLGLVSIKGMVGLDVENENYLPGDRYRLGARFVLTNTPMDFWGIGYENGRNNANKGSYKEFRIRFRPHFLIQLADNLHLGPVGQFLMSRTYDFTNAYLLNGQDRNTTALGLGGVFQYDSRDFAQNAYSGQYLMVEQMVYAKGLNRHRFNTTDVVFDTYHGLWRNAVLALDVHGFFTYGEEVPWTMLAQVAYTTKRMRGYYEGRYRDRNLIEAQAELRQRLPKRWGLAVFAGAANVFPRFGDMRWRQTLPNYGVGLRWEFKERINIRLDLGFTKHKPGVVFNINEAF